MSPNECLQLYIGLKLHFTTSYDFFKYGGKLKKAPDFSKRKDKQFFSWLSNKEDPRGLMIANMIKKPDMWIGDFFTEDAKTTFEEWRKRNESLSYMYKEQITDLEAKDFHTNGSHPEVLKRYMRGEISPETLVLLDHVLFIFGSWNRDMKGDPVWDMLKTSLLKYKPFISFDEAKIKQITLDNMLKFW